MKLENATVGLNTYEKLKCDIISGHIEPGAKLKLGQLKQQYGASVSTLREILNRLSSEGFVKAEEQRGFFVTPMSRVDLVEISNLRILLECHALELSIINGNTDWEGNVVAAHHKLHASEKLLLKGENAELERLKRRDWEFHLALIEACDNANLLALHTTIYDKYLRYQLITLTYRGEAAVKEHEEIFKAALARDIKTAKEGLTAHILGGLKDAECKLEARGIF